MLSAEIIDSISKQAKSAPSKAAAIVADAACEIDFAALEARSVELARLLRARGLQAGDRVAILLENSVEALIAFWAAVRAELRFVPINWHLKPDEVQYILDDCDALAVITQPELLELARASIPPDRELLRLIFGHGASGFESIEAQSPQFSPVAPPNERKGQMMPYSSGTTGHPKGILVALPDAPFATADAIDIAQRQLYDIDERAVMFAPSPIYHAAPSYWLMHAQRFGATAITLKRFDPETVLKTIERYRVTHAQFVPTHFVRLLRLPAEVRGRYDVSSLQVVMHAAAPCSIDVKSRMLDWWGPIIHEYYSGSEAAGFTSINSAEWRAHPGSVGKSKWGAVHIVDPDGNDCPIGEVGEVYFEDAQRFDYHKAPEKTAGFFNARGWGTLGDMGWLDTEGYLYLSDRKSDMIISGGVNIYPKEIEDTLALHPAIQDVAVIGVPDAEFGEQVKALVQAAAGRQPSAELAREIDAFCRTKIAGFKCPRSIDFVDKLPRTPLGKLQKRDLRQKYWGDAKLQI